MLIFLNYWILNGSEWLHLFPSYWWLLCPQPQPISLHWTLGRFSICLLEVRLRKGPISQSTTKLKVSTLCLLYHLLLPCLFTYSIYSFNKLLLDVYHVLDTLINTRDKVIHKRGIVSASGSLQSNKRDRHQTNNYTSEYLVMILMNTLKKQRIL